MKAFLISLLAALVALPAAAQVFTVTPEAINPKYLQFKRTDVPLSAQPCTRQDRQELLRFLQSEQGFAMRPLPVAVITLRANGPLKPNGLDYMNLLDKKGVAVHPGKRVVITNVKVTGNSIELDLNGGPFHRHRWLRHISVGTNPYYMQPIAPVDENHDPTGTRINLVFPHGVPYLTGLQVEALVRPLIDFSVKTPVQAYAETLPPFLQKAIAAHQVLVGMNREMVLSALGEPHTKMQEAVNHRMIKIWIYGEPPAPTEFVRFYGHRVVRVIIAPVGKPMQIFAKNQMGDYWSTQPAQNVHYVQLGDKSAASIAQQDANTAPPSLLNPGEKTPAADQSGSQMRKVILPKGMGNSQPASTSTGTTSTTTTNGQQGSQSPSSTPPSSTPQLLAAGEPY